MKKLTLFLLCILHCALCIDLKAQANDSVSELRLSLAEARDYAIEHNRTLQNADLSVRQAYATRWQTIASMLPQADMSLGLNYTDGKMKFALQDGMPPMEREIENLAGSLGVSASIAVNGQLIMGALINNTAIEMQDINKRNTELDVVSNVETYYITALAMEKTVELLDKSLIDLENLYNITENSVKVGAVEQTTADQIKVQVASMRSAINATNRSLEMIYNALALQLAAGADVKLVLTDELDNVLNVEEALNLLSMDFDLANNYSYQLAEQNVKMAKQNVIMAGMAYVPTLSAFYQYTAPNKYFSGETAMEQSMGVVGLQLSIPLWSSGKRAAGITEKKLARQAAENSLADARDGLMVQHKQLRYNLSSAYEDFDTQKLNIDVSQRVFESTSNKFEYGHASSLELTNASMTLLTAQSDYVQAILNLVNAQIELKKLLNK
ncbi:MAG: TolC family protein [Paludibacteraceae bacterium]|nr:TolC family protein [Paludibacteraceae bacterium]